MKNGKVVIIGGNKRAGKSTLGRLLQTKYGYNYYNMDHITNSVDSAWFKDGLPLNDYFPFMESLIEYALTDASRHGINSVFEFIYSPKVYNKLKSKDNLEFYYLANLDLNEDNIRDILIKYSKDYEYSSRIEDVERNVKVILDLNKKLKDECNKYNVELINTSYGTKRDEIINNLALEIVNK